MRFFYLVVLLICNKLTESSELLPGPSELLTELLRSSAINLTRHMDITGPVTEKSLTNTMETERKALLTSFDYIDPSCLDESLWGNQVTKIVGGNVGDASRWPYLVSLQTWNSKGELRHFCAGVMVAHHSVLTTAHCIKDFRESEYSFLGMLREDVYAAIMPQCRHQQGSGRRKVIGYDIHPDYSPQHISNDLALLWLDTATNDDVWDTFVDYKAAKTFTDLSQQNNFVYTMGWGGMGFNDSTSERFNGRMVPLQYATMTIIDKSECQLEMLTAGVVGNSVRIDGDSMICAKSFMGEDTCDGDSGGPLIVPDVMGVPTGDIVLGLTSWGPDTVCGGDLVLPGVYTKLNSFVDWIDQAIVDLQTAMLYSSVMEYSLGQLFENASQQYNNQSNYTTVINVSFDVSFQLPHPATEQSNPVKSWNSSSSEEQQSTLKREEIALSNDVVVNIEIPEVSTTILMCHVKNMIQNATSTDCN